MTRPLRTALLAAAVPLLLATAAAAQPITLRTAATQPVTRSPVDTLSVPSVALALLAVISLILLCRWGAKRFLTGNIGTGNSRAVSILSRTVVSPRQQIMLVQVGRRLLVVANAGAQMNTLCEVTHPDEVAELLAQLRPDTRDPLSRAFGSLFRREEAKFDPTSNGALDDAPADPNRSNSDDDAVLAAARSELSGLMDRVRGLSSQFKRP